MYLTPLLGWRFFENEKQVSIFEWNLLLLPPQQKFHKLVFKKDLLIY